MTHQFLALGHGEPLEKEVVELELGAGQLWETSVSVVSCCGSVCASM